MSTAPTSFGRRPTRKTDSSRRALALGLAVSTLGAGTLALTVPSLASATTPGCTDVLAVMTPGTWETTSDADPSVPVGMLAAVGNSLKTKYNNKVEIFYTPPYSASAFDQGENLRRQQGIGHRRHQRQSQHCRRELSSDEIHLLRLLPRRGCRRRHRIRRRKWERLDQRRQGPRRRSARGPWPRN